MIRRSRPKYYDSAYLNSAIEPLGYPDEEANELYFNYGRNALCFFLQQLGSSYGRPVKIGMQSFNCRVVLDAAIRSKCEVFLYDIKLADFSLSFDELERKAYPLDVLLLTHYQGIPNFEYLRIADYCSKNGIILIDDISLTENSHVDGVKVGSAGNIALRSFAFDKPFTSYKGGSIVLHHIDANLAELLRSGYSGLKPESKLKEALDLKKLDILFNHSSPEKYSPNVDRLVFAGLLLYVIPAALLLKLLGNKYFYKLLKVVKRYFPIKNQVRRIGGRKIFLVKAQERNFHKNQVSCGHIESVLKKFGIQQEIPEGIEIHWNRYSVINKNNLGDFLIKNGIEAGNYNWPQALHELKEFQKYESSLVEGSMEKSEYASRNVLNIPCWTKLPDTIIND